MDELRSRLPIILLMVLLIAARFGTAVTAQPAGPYVSEFDIEAIVDENDCCFVSLKLRVVVPADYSGVLRAVELPLTRRVAFPPIIGNISDLRAYPQGISLSWTDSLLMSQILIISFEESLEPGGSEDVLISFSAHQDPRIGVDNVTGTPDGKIFRYTFFKPNITIYGSSSTLRVSLPPNSQWTNFPNIPEMFSNPQWLLTMGTDPSTGSSTIEWNLSSMGAQESEAFFYCTYGVSQTSTPAPTQSPTPDNVSRTGIPMSYWVASNVIFVVATFSLTWLLFSRRTGVEIRPKKIPQVKLPPGKLSERDLRRTREVIDQLGPEEMGIVSLLARQGGSIRQKDMPRRVELSKSKISRMLKRLENMRVISRAPEGRTKWVSLSPVVLAYLMAEMGEPKVPV